MNNQFNDRSTIHLRNLSSEVDEDLLFELGVQFGEVVRIALPMNKLTQQREEFGFIEFASAADAQYMRDVIRASLAPLRLFGRNVTVSYRGDQKNDAADALLDIGARITIAPVDPKVCDAESLRTHFGQFGRLAVPPTIVQEPGDTTGSTATVSFTAFEFSDAAIKATNGQFLFGKRVRVDYAMRQDGKGRHGSEEERALYEGGGGGGGRRGGGNSGGGGGGGAQGNARLAPAQPHVAAQQQLAGDAAPGVPDWARNLNPYTST